MLGLRVLLAASIRAAGWAIFDSHPTRRVVATLIASYSAIAWLIEAVGLSLALEAERGQHEKWGREKNVDEKLLELELRIGEVAADSVLTEAARARREWQALSDLGLETVRCLQPGDTINLVSCSYIPPSGDSLAEHFQFLFNDISDGPVSSSGYEVRGQRRDDSRHEWCDERFYVNASEATTRTGLGSIRRLPADRKSDCV